MTKTLWLTAAIVLSGCGRGPVTGANVPRPTTAEPQAATTVAALPASKVVELVPGKGGASFSSSGAAPALLAVAQGRPRTETVSLAIGPTAGTGPATAYRTLSAEPGASSASTDPAVALRRWEKRFDGVTPRPRNSYQLQATAPGAVGDREKFWVIQAHEGDQVTERSVTGRTVYAGEHCYVVVDEQTGSSLDARAREVGEEFDRNIYAADARLFGAPNPEAARGGDSRVTILISPAVGNFGKDGTLGYFTLRDLFSPADDPEEPALAHSNSRFMLYMAANVVQRGTKADYLGTLAHEFQHLISATHKIYGEAHAQEDLWLNEGLSMYAMQANGYGLPSGSPVVFHHVEEFLSQPAAFSLTHFESPGGAGYGAVYLFTTYLTERFGEGILKELIASPEVGIANVEARLAARGSSFDQVFRDWVAALLLDGTRVSSDPRHQFNAFDLLGTYGGRKLNGVTLEAVTLPDAGNVRMLPYSASYYALEGKTEGAYSVQIPQKEGVGGWLVTP